MLVSSIEFASSWFGFQHFLRAEVQRWADALGIDRSEILRDALHRHLVVLKGEAEAQRWEEQPATEAERSLEGVADWGPAEDWTDWANAEG